MFAQKTIHKKNVKCVNFILYFSKKELKDITDNQKRVYLHSEK